MGKNKQQLKTVFKEAAWWSHLFGGGATFESWKGHQFIFLEGGVQRYLSKKSYWCKTV